MEASELPNASFACLLGLNTLKTKRNLLLLLFIIYFFLFLLCFLKLGVIVAYFTSVSLGDSLFTMIMKFRRIPYVSPSLPKSVDSEYRRLEDIMSTKRLFVTPRTTIGVLKQQRDFALKVYMICLNFE
jgi:hypothetical protein